jgi:methylation protein EvaC
MTFVPNPVEWSPMAGKAKKCAFCGSTNLSEVIDFGEVAVAGAFLKKEDFPEEKKYQLTIVFCNDCFAVQVRDHVDPKVLFEHDFYFSSAIKTLRDHFAEYASEVTARFLSNPKQSVVVEFGSNDGVLLKPFADQGVKTIIGVDPATNVVKSIEDDRLILVNDFFNVSVAQDIVKKHGKADLVCANNAYAHISDINGVTEAVTEVLADDGVFIFEVHYLGKIIQDMQYAYLLLLADCAAKPPSKARHGHIRH